MSLSLTRNVDWKRLGRRCVPAFLFALSVSILFTISNVAAGNYRARDGMLYENGRVIGGDFYCFYTAGRIAAADVRSIYDMGRQRADQRALLGEQFSDGLFLPFIYPPPVAALFSVFVTGSYLHSYLLWVLFSALVFLVCVSRLIVRLPLSGTGKALAFLMSLAFVPFSIDCLGSGQTAALGLAAFTGAWILYERNNSLLAGMVFGLGFYKPPLFVLFGLIMLLRREWRFVAGAMLTALILSGISVALVGIGGFLAYIELASNYRYGVEFIPGVSLPPNQGVGFYSLMYQIFGGGSRFPTIITALCALCFALWSARGTRGSSREGRAIQFAMWISGSLYFSLQMLYYDLTMLILPLLLVAAVLLRQATGRGAIVSWFVAAAVWLEWVIPKETSGQSEGIVVRLVFTAWIVMVMCLSASRSVSRAPVGG